MAVNDLKFANVGLRDFRLLQNPSSWTVSASWTLMGLTLGACGGGGGGVSLTAPQGPPGGDGGNTVNPTHPPGGDGGNTVNPTPPLPPPDEIFGGGTTPSGNPLTDITLSGAVLAPSEQAIGTLSAMTNMQGGPDPSLTLVSESEDSSLFRINADNILEFVGSDPGESATTQGVNGRKHFGSTYRVKVKAKQGDFDYEKTFIIPEGSLYISTEVGGEIVKHYSHHADADGDGLLDENAEGPIMFGTLSTLRAGSWTLSLTSGYDNSDFMINSGGELVYTGSNSGNFEAGHTKVIEVQLEGDSIATETYTIRLSDVKEPITLQIDASTANMRKGDALVLTDAMIRVSDPEQPARNFDFDSDLVILRIVTISNGRLERDGVEIDRFSLAELRAGQVRFIHDGTVPEDSDPTSLTLSVTDSDGSHDSLNNRAIEIRVADTNTGPMGIVLSREVLLPKKATVGFLEAIDDDTSSRHTFTLTGNGEDDHLFRIRDGNRLKFEGDNSSPGAGTITQGVNGRKRFGDSYTVKITVSDGVFDHEQTFIISEGSLYVSKQAGSGATKYYSNYVDAEGNGLLPENTQDDTPLGQLSSLQSGKWAFGLAEVYLYSSSSLNPYRAEGFTDADYTEHYFQSSLDLFQAGGHAVRPGTPSAPLTITLLREDGNHIKVSGIIPDIPPAASSTNHFIYAVKDGERWSFARTTDATRPTKSDGSHYDDEFYLFAFWDNEAGGRFHVDAVTSGNIADGRPWAGIVPRDESDEIFIYSASTLNPYRPEGFTESDYTEHYFRTPSDIFAGSGEANRLGTAGNPLEILFRDSDGGLVQIKGIVPGLPSEVSGTNHFIYAVKDGESWSFARTTDATRPTKSDGSHYDDELYLFAFWDNEAGGRFQVDSVTNSNIADGRPWAGVAHKVENVLDWSGIDNREFSLDINGRLVYTGRSNSFEESEPKVIEVEYKDLQSEEVTVGSGDYIYRTTTRNYYLHPNGPSPSGFNPDTDYHYFESHIDLRPGIRTTTRYGTQDNPLDITLLRDDGEDIRITGRVPNLPSRIREIDGRANDDHYHFIYAAREGEEWSFVYGNNSPTEVPIGGEIISGTPESLRNVAFWLDADRMGYYKFVDELVYLFTYWDDIGAGNFWIDHVTTAPWRDLEGHHSRGHFQNGDPYDGLYRVPSGTVLFEGKTSGTGESFKESYTINLSDVNDPPRVTFVNGQNSAALEERAAPSQTASENIIDGIRFRVADDDDTELTIRLSAWSDLFRAVKIPDDPLGTLYGLELIDTIGSVDAGQVGYSFNITARDDSNAESTELAIVTITIEPSNDHAPTGIALSRYALGYKSTFVGTFSAIDADQGDRHHFGLTGNGEDDSLFNITTWRTPSGEVEFRLHTITSTTYGTGLRKNPGDSYEIEVITTDSGGLTHTQTLTIAEGTLYLEKQGQQYYSHHKDHEGRGLLDENYDATEDGNINLGRVETIRPSDQEWYYQLTSDTANNDNSEFRINTHGDLIYVGGSSGNFEAGDTKQIEVIATASVVAHAGSSDYIYRHPTINPYGSPFNPNSNWQNYFRSSIDLRPRVWTSTRLGTEANPLDITLLRDNAPDVRIQGHVPGLPSQARNLGEGGRQHYIYAVRNDDDWSFAIRTSDIFYASSSDYRHLLPNGSYDETVFLFAYRDKDGRFAIGIHKQEFGIAPIKYDGLNRVSSGSHVIERVVDTFTEPYTITLDNVNEPLQLAIDASTATLNEGEAITLTEEMISIIDPDNPNRDFTSDADQIILTIVSIAHGTLQRDGTEYVTQFTLAELRAGRITFLHDSSEPDEDDPARVKLSVTDFDGERASINNRTLEFTTTATNDNAPTAIILSSEALAPNKATVGFLSATDADQDNMHTFTLTGDAPDNHLFRVRDGNRLKFEGDNSTPGAGTITQGVNGRKHFGEYYTVTLTVSDGDFDHEQTFKIPEASLYIARQSKRYFSNYEDGNGNGLINENTSNHISLGRLATNQEGSWDLELADQFFYSSSTLNPYRSEGFSEADYTKHYFKSAENLFIQSGGTTPRPGGQGNPLTITLQREDGEHIIIVGTIPDLPAAVTETNHFIYAVRDGEQWQFASTPDATRPTKSDGSYYDEEFYLFAFWDNDTTNIIQVDSVTQGNIDENRPWAGIIPEQAKDWFSTNNQKFTINSIGDLIYTGSDSGNFEEGDTLTIEVVLTELVATGITVGAEDHIYRHSTSNPYRYDGTFDGNSDWRGYFKSNIDLRPGVEVSRRHFSSEDPWTVTLLREDEQIEISGTVAGLPPTVNTNTNYYVYAVRQGEDWSVIADAKTRYTDVPPPTGYDEVVYLMRYTDRTGHIETDSVARNAQRPNQFFYGDFSGLHPLSAGTVLFQGIDMEGDSFTEPYTIKLADANDLPTFSFDSSVTFDENGYAIGASVEENATPSQTASENIIDGIRFRIADEEDDSSGTPLMLRLSNYTDIFSTVKLDDPAGNLYGLELIGTIGNAERLANAYIFNVSAVDSQQGESIATGIVRIAINDINESPTGVSIDRAALIPDSRTIGVLEAIDEDATGNYSFTLTGNGADNHLFQISAYDHDFNSATPPHYHLQFKGDGTDSEGRTLTPNINGRKATGDFYEVTITVSDNNGEFEHEANLTIADGSLYLEQGSADYFSYHADSEGNGLLDENASGNINLGRFSTTRSTNSGWNFTLTPDTANNANSEFEINNSGQLIYTGSDSGNFEAGDTHKVEIEYSTGVIVEADDYIYQTSAILPWRHDFDSDSNWQSYFRSSVDLNPRVETNIRYGHGDHPLTITLLREGGNHIVISDPVPNLPANADGRVHYIYAVRNGSEWSFAVDSTSVVFNRNHLTGGHDESIFLFAYRDDGGSFKIGSLKEDAGFPFIEYNGLSQVPTGTDLFGGTETFTETYTIRLADIDEVSGTIEDIPVAPIIL